MNNRKVLVVYYSRTGVTKKIAETIAQNVKCDIEEIIDTVGRKGFWGIIKSSFEALKGKPSVIKETNRDVLAYDVVAIGTPVWAGRMSCAIRAYLEKNKGKFRKVVFFSTQKGDGKDTIFEDMENICGTKPLSTMKITGSKINNGGFINEAKKFAGEIMAI